jgi:hypothetical protein
MRIFQLGFLTAALCCAGCVHGLAQNVVTVSECPGKALPLTFQVDCTHVADPAMKQQCKIFAQNQACKVFFAYRDITGINLEQDCSVFKYTIWDADQWQHPRGEGGFAVRCGAEIITDVALKIDSPIGTYDVHEILHVYQEDLGALPYEHILFGPSMAEARKRIGDNKGYWDAMTQMKEGMARSRIAFDKGTVVGDQCVSAEIYTEEDLYLKDPRNVELMYRKLERGRLKDQTDRERRFNRMYDVVSGGMAKQFLLKYCPVF